MQKILKIVARGRFLGQKWGLCVIEIAQAEPEKRAGL